MGKSGFSRAWLVSALVAGVISTDASVGDAWSQEAPASACAVLEEIVASLFDADPSAVTFRPSSASGHDVCRAIWEIPGIDNDERTRRAIDKDLRAANEVSLTIMGTRFETAEEAVADLERDVARLKEGITVKVAGRERTTKREFGEWLEGVGDRAIPTSKGTVMVAADGIRFTAASSTTDDAAEKLALSIELAKRIVDGL